jgi:hypothetical protein
MNLDVDTNCRSEANNGNKVFTAIPSKCERKPNPRADANEPSAGKHAVQLRAASQTPPEPTLSRILLIITIYLNF